MALVVVALAVLLLVLIVAALVGRGPQDVILEQCRQRGYRVLGSIRQETYDWPKRFVLLCSDQDNNTRRVEFEVEQGNRVTMTSSDVVDADGAEGGHERARQRPISPYERYDDPADEVSLRPGPVYPGLSFDRTGESPVDQPQPPEQSPEMPDPPARHDVPPELPGDAPSGRDLSELTRTLIEVSRSVRDLGRRLEAVEARLWRMETPPPMDRSPAAPDTSPPPTTDPPERAAGDETIDPMN
ncbi:MAG: hypothetical protein ACOCXX_00730 [Planctomycetota bacterium]